MAGAEKKYGGRLPTIPIEPEKEAAIRAIADSMGVSIATIMRWGVDHLIHTYGGRVAGKAQAIEIPEFDPEISKPTF